MIIVKFQGGLGNQMFQYAYYKELQKLFPGIPIYADISEYSFPHCFRKYELDKDFGISLNIASNKDIIRLSDNVPYSEKITNFKKKRNFFLEKYLNFNLSKMYPHYLRLNDIPKKNFETNEDYYLEGFWCTEVAFEHVRNEIIEDFRKPIEESNNLHFDVNYYLKDWKNKNTVSIHIRRTDYLNGNGFFALSTDYYRNAILLISQKIENPFFVFFSDDTNYVESEYGWLDNKKIITENSGDNSYKDLLLMAECKHNIIANSTFSFWGAYLNVNPKKIVVAPAQYMSASNKPLAATNWTLLDI